MKKILFMVAALCLFMSCQKQDSVTVTVANSLDFQRDGAMVEVSMKEIDAKLGLADTAQIVVLDAKNKQVPYQITYDNMVVFPANVTSNGTAVYRIEQGTPEEFGTKTCGRFYPERMDDVAWENDLVAFRAYGPALQRSGERAFGYDVWTKYNTTDPVVEGRYASELNPETKAQIAELRKTDPKAASELYRSVSYHVDHGYGLDCYKVGPTLGGGANGLMIGDSLIYPYAFASHEILDNGPLRFTVKLVYTPFTIANDSNVVETRIISLDAGSYMNKAVISYSNLTKVTPVATGLVLHEPDGAVVSDATAGYITYVDPTDNVNNDNGLIFVGAAFPNDLVDAKVVLFPELEKKTLRGGADGHVLAISNYTPGKPYVYYFGSAWSKAAIKTADEWNSYMANYTKAAKSPLTVTVK